MTPEAPRHPVTPEQTDAAMTAAKGLAGVIAASLTTAEERVTLPQFRVLVLAAGDQPLTLAVVAQALGVHASNATRICDRLVAAGLLERTANPADRRQVHLRLTDDGRELLSAVMNHRRTLLEAILLRMAPEERQSLMHAFVAFGAHVEHVLDDTTGYLMWVDAGRLDEDTVR